MSAGPELLSVALGGALGAMLRAGFHRALARLARSRQRAVDPSVATLLANGLGCAALSAWIATGEVPGADRSAALEPLVTIGLCGGLTTFSTLCADALRLRRATPSAAAIYLAATIAVGLGGWSLGALLA